MDRARLDSCGFKRAFTLLVSCLLLVNVSVIYAADVEPIWEDHSDTLIDRTTVVVSAQSSLEWTLNIPYFNEDERRQVYVGGSFSAQGGSGNDIHVILYTSGNQVIYNSYPVHQGEIDVSLNAGGTYRLVAANGFSLFSNKAVTLWLTLYYQQRNKGREEELKQHLEQEEEQKRHAEVEQTRKERQRLEQAAERAKLEREKLEHAQHASQPQNDVPAGTQAGSGSQNPAEEASSGRITVTTTGQNPGNSWFWPLLVGALGIALIASLAIPIVVGRKRCPSCLNRIHRDAIKCPKCRTDLEVQSTGCPKCGKCGKPFYLDASFCIRCGSPVATSPPQPTNKV